MYHYNAGRLSIHLDMSRKDYIILLVNIFLHTSTESQPIAIKLLTSIASFSLFPTPNSVYFYYRTMINWQDIKNVQITIVLPLEISTDGISSMLIGV